MYQNIYSIEKSGADYVLVLAADHVYKMDYRPMLEFHRHHGGTVTVATLRCPVTEAAGRFGVIESDQFSQVVGFREKPVLPAQLPGDQVILPRVNGNLCVHHHLPNRGTSQER